MDSPFIITVNPNKIFENGEIEILGENFSSTATLLLINGIESEIKSNTGERIIGTVPEIDETNIYDIKVMTRSVYRQDKNLFSNSFFVEINNN